MNLQLLKIATLTLIAIAFLALEKMTNNPVFWMLGILFFVTVVVKLFAIENKEISQSQITERIFRS